MALSIVRALADEGMWLPMLLGEQVYKEMVRKGLKLKPEKTVQTTAASYATARRKSSSREPYQKTAVPSQAESRIAQSATA